MPSSKHEITMRCLPLKREGDRLFFLFPFSSNGNGDGMTMIPLDVVRYSVNPAIREKIILTVMREGDTIIAATIAAPATRHLEALFALSSIPCPAISQPSPPPPPS